MRLRDFDAKAKTNLVFNGVLECVVGEAGGGLNVGRHDGDEVLEVHQICNEVRGRKVLAWVIGSRRGIELLKTFSLNPYSLMFCKKKGGILAVPFAP